MKPEIFTWLLLLTMTGISHEQDEKKCDWNPEKEFHRKWRRRNDIQGCTRTECISTTCKGRCGSRISGGHCQCDEFCLKYGDCCPNYLPVCKNRSDNDTETLQFLQNEQQKSRYSCEPLEYIRRNSSTTSKFTTGDDVNTEIYSHQHVVRCSTPYRDQAELVRQCEGQIQSNSIAHILPVTRKGTTGPLYRNAYCALCNGEKLDDLTPWPGASLLCQNATTQRQHQVNESCFLAFDATPTQERKNECAIEANTCIGSKMHLQSLCKAYNLPISLLDTNDNRTSTNYKNPHCLACSTKESDIPEFECSSILREVPEVLAMAPIRLSLIAEVSFDLAIKESLLTYACNATEAVIDFGTRECWKFTPPLIQTGQQGVGACDTPFLSANEPRSMASSPPIAYSRYSQAINTILANLSKLLGGEQKGQEINGLSANISLGHDSITGSSIAKISRYLENRTTDETPGWRIELQNYRKRNCMKCGEGYVEPTIVDNVPKLVVRNSKDFIQLGNELYPIKNVRLVYSFHKSTSSDAFESTLRVSYCKPRIHTCATKPVDSGKTLKLENSYLMVPGLKPIPPGAYRLVSSTVAEVCADKAKEIGFTLEKLNELITLIGLSLSIIFLVVTICTFLFFATLRNLPGLITLNLATALLLLDVFILAGSGQVSHKRVCVAMAVVIHYCWLALFAWLAAYGFNVLRTFTKQIVNRKTSSAQIYRKLIAYMAGAWLAPLTLIIVGLGLHFGTDYRVYGSDETCWIDGLFRLTLLQVPVGLVQLVNFAILIGTMVRIHKTNKQTNQILRKESSSLLAEISIGLKMVCVLGIPWILFIPTVFSKNAVMAVVFSVVNSLQGVFLSIALLFNARICKMYKRSASNRLSTLTSRLSIPSRSSRSSRCELIGKKDVGSMAANDREKYRKLEDDFVRNSGGDSSSAVTETTNVDTKL